jgi:O-acetylhomoserine/O-acetylserine sulfhydrylase-like pyridoxal-dependent enzyme
MPAEAKVHVEYHKGLDIAYRKARKERNAEAMVWYAEAHNKVAVASFETLKGSAWYDTWKTSHAAEITEAQRILKLRF